MKKVLLLMTMALLVSSVAMADHIAVYVDDQGINCNLAAGFSSTATVVYKGWTPGGSTGARFKITTGSSTIFSFQTQYVVIGDVNIDLSIAYGNCVEGNFPIGTLVANWTAGDTGAVVEPTPFPFIMTRCDFAEIPITGGTFCIAAPGDCDCSEPIATEPTSWGKVKALYR